MAPDCMLGQVHHTRLRMGLRLNGQIGTKRRIHNGTSADRASMRTHTNRGGRADTKLNRRTDGRDAAYMSGTKLWHACWYGR